MERIADVEQRKSVIATESTSYVAGHPQLKQLLHDFITTVLASKPANVHLFARDYFSNFLPESTADAELDALAEEMEEESLLKGDQDQ